VRPGGRQRRQPLGVVVEQVALGEADRLTVVLHYEQLCRVYAVDAGPILPLDRGEVVLFAPPWLDVGASEPIREERKIFPLQPTEADLHEGKLPIARSRSRLPLAVGRLERGSHHSQHDRPVEQVRKVRKLVEDRPQADPAVRPRRYVVPTQGRTAELLFTSLG
jgi:hypothetical protein